MLRITPLDEDKASSGSWTRYRSVDIKIARAGNDKFQKVFSSLTRPHKFLMDKGELDDDIMKDIICETLSKSILVDWKNFKVSDKNIKYSQENAYELLLNDPDCREFVQSYANTINNYLSTEESLVKEKS